MADTINTPNSSQYALEKLKVILDRVAERTRSGSTALSTALAEANAAFAKYFQEIGDPEFTPKLLLSGDNPRSDIYNENMQAIYEDLRRFYRELLALAESQVKAFNYSTISNEELIKRADNLASTVLDLNILSNLTRGDVIVAGDDFRNLDSVDTTVATASQKAEKMPGSAGMSLKREGSESVVDGSSAIEVFPIGAELKRTRGAGSTADTITSEPTPGNLERFYEGNYYNFLGQARPEGGQFNVKYVTDPTKVAEKEKNPTSQETTKKDNTTTITNKDEFTAEDVGFYVDLGASEDVKKQARLRMVDGNADTFWECEYVVKTDPLLSFQINDSEVEDQEKNKSEGPKGATINIDIREAEKAAIAADEKRDLRLAVEIVVNLKEPKNINLVILNPVLFGTQSFIVVDDIATATDKDGAFETVEGWSITKFAKTITPEANEFLTDTQLAQSLSPSRYEYTGIGVFPFPVRTAQRIKIKLFMDSPVPNLYERYYIMLKNQVEIETEVKTTTKRGIFG